jgi:hypothetical protein
MALHKKAGLPETFQAEIIFRKHSSDAAAKGAHLGKNFQEIFVDATWRELIHKCLYKKVSKLSFADLTNGHKYLDTLAELVWKSKFTVTFDFDDIVDEATTNYAGAHSVANPEVILRPKLETRQDAPVIYHIKWHTSAGGTQT